MRVEKGPPYGPAGRVPVASREALDTQGTALAVRPMEVPATGRPATTVSSPSDTLVADVAHKGVIRHPMAVSGLGPGLGRP